METFYNMYFNNHRLLGSSWDLRHLFYVGKDCQIAFLISHSVPRIPIWKIVTLELWETEMRYSMGSYKVSV